MTFFQVCLRFPSELTFITSGDKRKESLAVLRNVLMSHPQQSNGDNCDDSLGLCDEVGHRFSEESMKVIVVGARLLMRHGAE